MSASLTEKPGAHERHLLRRRNNPLFPQPLRFVSPQDIAEARRLDQEERERFEQEFRELVQQAVSLKALEESEVILELKARLDRACIHCAGLGGDSSSYLPSVDQLIDLIVKAVRTGAGEDPTAHRELDAEEMARAKSRELLAYPLVADLMRPDSPVGDRELLPVLLSASPEELEAALWLFDAGQLAVICAEARNRLHRDDVDGSQAFAAAADNLQRMESQLAQAASATTAD